MAFVTADGVRIYYRLEGDEQKPVIVFLHGIGTDHGLFGRLVPLLIDDYRLLRMDIRGHGASDVPAGDYKMPRLADDVLAVLDAENIPNAIICGLSLGGMVAMQFAERSPDRVAGLVLACTSPEMSPEFWAARCKAVREQGLRSVTELTLGRQYSPGFIDENPQWVGASRHVLNTMDSDGYAGCGAAIRDMNIHEGLREIQVPVMVLAGKLDQATPFDGNGSRIVAALPCAEVVLLETGHLASIEDPESFAAAVRELAGRCARPVKSS